MIFAKAWGFPMIVAASEPDALEIADRLLTGEDAATIANLPMRKTLTRSRAIRVWTRHGSASELDPSAALRLDSKT